MPAILPATARFPRSMPWRAALLPRALAALTALVMVAGQAAALLSEDQRAAALAFHRAGWTSADLAAAAQLARRCTLAQRHQRSMIAGSANSRQAQDDRNHGDDCRG